MNDFRCDKLGLALSGGGFRASLFHIGVLAQMADRGMLRHVEVISTVSGGSIVGALYYLHLKRLLETKDDAHITDDDYRRLVRNVESEFLVAAQANLRLHTFANARANWRMRHPHYSRSDRLGELYDKYLYRPAYAAGGDTGEPVRMRSLKIAPLGAPPNFHPRRDNARRRAKVPILLINATSLNTGRNWRFEAVRMGEPPRADAVAENVDKVTRLVRPPRYDVLPPHLADIPLGTAVAASTAVPGLFRPLPISKLYPARLVQLVDGGVHDNQGIQGLMDERCQYVVISDASSQMDETKRPSISLASVLSRVNSVLMHRVREEQLFHTLPDHIKPRVGLIHMRCGLRPIVVPWQPGAAERAPIVPPEAPTPVPGHIDPNVQQLLARVRTDLDAFTEVEAFSLMQAGYTLSSQALDDASVPRELQQPVQQSAWQFAAVKPWLMQPTAQYLKHLQVASGNLFKLFRLQPWLRNGLLLAAALIFIIVLTCGSTFLRQPRTITVAWTWWHILAAIGGGALLLVGRYAPVRYLLQFFSKPLSAVYRWAWSVVTVALAPFVRLYLLTLNRLFLAQGTMERLQPEQPPVPPAAAPGRPRRSL